MQRSNCCIPMHLPRHICAILSGYANGNACNERPCIFTAKLNIELLNYQLYI